MKKNFKKLAAIGLSIALAMSLAGCGSNDTAQTSETSQSSAETNSEKAADSQEVAAADESQKEVTIKITWWGGQTRHDYTQQLLDLYTELHPNVTFEAMPSGWDGYFDKLATQAASGAMPDIIQMDYLYISTYAKNNSIADLQEFINDGTIDVSGMDENILNTGKIDGKMTGLPLATSLLAVGYNPAVLAEAGLEAPENDWTWNDFVAMNQTIKDKTGKMGVALGPVDDTNLFNYWVRQNGAKLFSDDNKSLGYTDDSICASYIQMWKDMMDGGLAPNPDEYAAIQTLGQEAGPVVTGDSAWIVEWNNYTNKVAAVNDTLKLATPPMADESSEKGLWLKPGMFFSVAETSAVKKEAAEFINWFVNSKEANDIIKAERGTPVSSEIRDYMMSSGTMSQQQQDMFAYVDLATALCSETPNPDPIGMSEVNEAFKNAAYRAFYGQITAEDAAAQFRQEADEILQRNN